MNERTGKGPAAAAQNTRALNFRCVRSHPTISIPFPAVGTPSAYLVDGGGRVVSLPAPWRRGSPCPGRESSGVEPNTHSDGHGTTVRYLRRRGSMRRTWPQHRENGPRPGSTGSRATTLGCESTPKPPGRSSTGCSPAHGSTTTGLDTATRSFPAQPTCVGPSPPTASPSQPYPIARTTATAPISRGPTGPGRRRGREREGERRRSTCLPFQEDPVHSVPTTRAGLFGRS